MPTQWTKNPAKIFFPFKQLRAKLNPINRN